MEYNILFRPFVDINEKELESYGKTYFLRGYMLIPKNDTALIDKYKSNLRTYCNLRREDPFPKPYTKSRFIKGFYFPVNYNYRFFTEDHSLDMSKYELVKIPGLHSGEYLRYNYLNKVGFRVYNISEIVSIINLIMNL